MDGQRLSRLGITDPLFVQKLDQGHDPIVPCLVTISLSMPYRPPDWDKDDPCWKLIAAVIELEENNNSSENELPYLPF